MSDGRTQDARKRVEDASKRVEAAKDRTLSVSRDAREAIAAASARVKAAAQQGASWKVLELFIHKSLTALGTTSYLWVSAIGLFYTIAFYFNFKNIHIFDYFSTPDFLLSAFANASVPIIAGVVTAASLVFSWQRFFKVSFDRAYMTGRHKEYQVRPWRNALDFLAVPVLVTIGLPMIAGWHAGNSALGRDERNVRVTISQSSDSGAPRLPGSNQVKMLGTTSGYHIFYECAPDSAESRDTKSNDDSCDDGQPLIVPNANIVALEFNSRRVSGPGSSELSSAIIELKAAIDKLVPITFIKTGSATGPIDLTFVIQAIASLEKRLGIEHSEVSDSISELQDQIGVSPGPTIIGQLNGLELIATHIKDVTLRIEAAIQDFPPVTTCWDDEQCAKSTELQALKKVLISLRDKIEAMKSFRPQDSCFATMDLVGTVGSFPSGKHEPDKAPNDTSLHNGVSSVACKLKQDTPQHVFLVGRVDVERLAAKPNKEYTTDIELARRRANWVKDELIGKTVNRDLKNVLGRAILLSDGPFHTSAPHEADRRVDVWACWEQARTTDWSDC